MNGLSRESADAEVEVSPTRAVAMPRTEPTMRPDHRERERALVMMTSLGMR
jgi:hypothetical protein